jgi:hypothetical protein
MCAVFLVIKSSMSAVFWSSGLCKWVSVCVFVLGLFFYLSHTLNSVAGNSLQSAQSISEFLSMVFCERSL